MFRRLGGRGRHPYFSRWLRSASFASLSLAAGSAALAWPPGSGSPVEETTVRAVDPAAINDAERTAFLGELGVLRWHGVGYRGQGVRIAVLDYGFRGYREKLKHGLPAEVRTKSFRRDGDIEARDSQHGILCAEILHTLAPDAEIVLADWEPDSPDSFFRALRWVKSEGVRAVTCSVVMPSWSDGGGGGPQHAALREILGAGDDEHDVSLFAAAGNLAQRHWAGPLRPNADGDHEWSPGQRCNRLLPWGNEPIAIELYGPPAECVVQVRDHDSGAILEKAELKTEGGAATAALRLEVQADRRYDIVLHVSGRPTGTFHLVVLGGDLDIARTKGSIPFPGDGTNVVTLGAVDRDHRRLAYSSCGPNSPRPKPDFVAQVPFPSRCRERPFTGTSAAAPQGAGLAALLLSRWPHSTPAEIHAMLRTSAVDLLTPGHDAETGYGLLRLP
jgi:Subtilase family